jgi:hypothetical protein
MPAPNRPKIYHILHVDRLASVVRDGYLWCDAAMMNRMGVGTTIGMGNIKERRLKELRLPSYPELFVGECTPFYFCPRSVMLFMIHRRNEELTYRGGQDNIIHLEADLYDAVAWASAHNRKWVFTLSNAGARYFDDRCDLRRLDDINWPAVQARQWSGNGIPRLIKEGKQAEFLIEHSLPWNLVERVGVLHQQVVVQVYRALGVGDHRPRVELRPEWYYPSGAG